MPAPALSDNCAPTVGTFLAIAAGRRRLIGVVTEVESNERAGGETRFGAVARVDLMGEIKFGRRRRRAFLARRLGLSRDRRHASASSGATNCGSSIRRRARAAITIGALHHDEYIAARVDVDNLLSKHFAILGSTGVGKSSGVAVILNEILDARPESAHLPARRPQRIRPLLRLARQCRQRLEPEAAVLAVQFRGIRRRALLRPARRRRGNRHSRRANPDRQGHSTQMHRLAQDRATVRRVDPRTRRLHRRHAGALYDPGPRRSDRRAHGQAREPRHAHALPSPAGAHRERCATTRATASCSRTPMSAATRWAKSSRHLFRLEPNGQPMTVHAGRRTAGRGGRRGGLAWSAGSPSISACGATARCRCCSSARRRIATRRPTLGRLRADAPRAAAHRQGGPQIRRLPRPRHPAPRRTRPDHHLPMQHAVRDAHGQRPRSGAAALGGDRRGRQSAGVRALAGHARSGRASAKACRCRRG